jgi:hypothetical protein
MDVLFPFFLLPFLVSAIVLTTTRDALTHQGMAGSTAWWVCGAAVGVFALLGPGGFFYLRWKFRDEAPHEEQS